MDIPPQRLLSNISGNDRANSKRWKTHDGATEILATSEREFRHTTTANNSSKSLSSVDACVQEAKKQLKKEIFNGIESWHASEQKFLQQTRECSKSFEGGHTALCRILFVSVIEARKEKDKSMQSNDDEPVNSLANVGIEIEERLHNLMTNCSDPLNTALMSIYANQKNEENKREQETEVLTPADGLGDLLKQRFKSNKKPKEKGPYKANPWMHDLTGGIVFVNEQNKSSFGQPTTKVPTATQPSEDSQAIVGFLEGPVQKLMFLLESIEKTISPQSDSDQTKPNLQYAKKTTGEISEPTKSCKKHLKFEDWGKNTRILLCSEDCPERTFTTPFHLFSVTPLASLHKESSNNFNASSTTLEPLDQMEVQAFLAKLCNQESAFVPKLTKKPPSPLNEANSFGDIKNSSTPRKSTIHVPPFVPNKVLTPLTQLDHQKMFPSAQHIHLTCGKKVSGQESSNQCIFPTWSQFHVQYYGPGSANIIPDETLPPWSWFQEKKIDIQGMNNKIKPQPIDDRVDDQVSNV